MLFKDLLNVLVTLSFYTIRIATYNCDTLTTIEENTYSMDEIPEDYNNYKVLTIHSSGSYDTNLYNYFVTVCK